MCMPEGTDEQAIGREEPSRAPRSDRGGEHVIQGAHALTQRRGVGQVDPPSCGAILNAGWTPTPITPAQSVRSAWSPSSHRPAAALAGWRRAWEASMWVSWVVARRLVVGLLLAALAFVGLEVTLFLLTALFPD